MYVKTKESGPLGGGARPVRPPPKSANDYVWNDNLMFRNSYNLDITSRLFPPMKCSKHRRAPVKMKIKLKPGRNSCFSISFHIPLSAKSVVKLSWREKDTVVFRLIWKTYLMISLNLILWQIWKSVGFHHRNPLDLRRLAPISCCKWAAK